MATDEPDEEKDVHALGRHREGMNARSSREEKQRRLWGSRKEAWSLGPICRSLAVENCGDKVRGTVQNIARTRGRRKDLSLVMEVAGSI